MVTSMVCNKRILYLKKYIRNTARKAFKLRRKDHQRKLQNDMRSSKKVLKLYEQYFLYFFKIENKATSYHSSGRPLTFAAHCR